MNNPGSSVGSVSPCYGFDDNLQPVINPYDDNGDEEPADQRSTPSTVTQFGGARTRSVVRRTGLRLRSPLEIPRMRAVSESAKDRLVIVEEESDINEDDNRSETHQSTGHISRPLIWRGIRFVKIQHFIRRSEIGQHQHILMSQPRHTKASQRLKI